MRLFTKSVRQHTLGVTTFIGIGVASGLGCGTPTEDVRGTAIDTLGSVEDPGSQSQQVWYQRKVQALSPMGLDYQSYSGLVAADGSFVIPGVPAGPYWLSFPDEVFAFPGDANVYVWTDAREFDLGMAGGGGPAGSSVSVSASITGLLPVQKGDYIEAYGTGHGWRANWGLSPPGAVTTMWPADSPIFLRSDPSEQIVVKQWRSSLVGSANVAATVRASSGPAPATDGTPLTFSLSDTVPGTFTASIDHAAFLSQLSGLGEPVDASLKLLANADPGGSWAFSDELILDLSTSGPSGGDPSVSGISYVDPYPASWSRRYELGYLSATIYPVVGSAVSASCGTGFVVTGAASELQPGPVRPGLSLPQALAIDGSPAAAARSGVSLAPVISWQAPQLGTVSFYLLRLVHLTKDSQGATPGTLVATFLTPETRASIPAGILQSGAQYYLELIAVSGADDVPLTAPRSAEVRQQSHSSAHLCSAAFQT